MFVDYGHSLSMHMHVGAEHYGMESMRFVAHHLDELRENYGVTEFDLVVPTHIHDDHTCGIPYLQRHHGTRCWALSQVAQVIEDPAAWASTPCTYTKTIRVERYLNDGESFTWEEYKFDIYKIKDKDDIYHTVAAEVFDKACKDIKKDFIKKNNVFYSFKSNCSHYCFLSIKYLSLIHI